jgi:hypothetical protein
MESDKEVTKQQKLRFFSLFLLDDGSIRICTNYDGSGTRRSKNIRIHNTAFYMAYQTLRHYEVGGGQDS